MLTALKKNNPDRYFPQLPSRSDMTGAKDVSGDTARRRPCLHLVRREGLQAATNRQTDRLYVRDAGGIPEGSSCLTEQPWPELSDRAALARAV